MRDVYQISYIGYHDCSIPLYIAQHESAGPASPVEAQSLHFNQPPKQKCRIAAPASRKRSWSKQGT